MKKKYNHRQLLVFSIVALIITSLAGINQAAAAEQPPPFGLKWGLSPVELEQLGIKLSARSDTEHGELHVLSNLPKVISGSQLVAGYFGYNEKLWRIAWQSTPWQNDPYGNGVQKRYLELKSILRKKYGAGSTQHHAGDSYFSKPKNFLYGILRGERWHYTNYQTSGIWVQLGIRASSSNDGYLILIYENNALKRNFKDGKEKKEEDAL